MTHLNQKEWVAVIVAIFVIGFFFVFGQGLISLFTNKTNVLQVTTPQLQIQDNVVGGGEPAVAGSRITVNYVGRFTDGKVFDSSVARNEPFQFVLGTNQVIKGWDQGLLGMRVGGKRTIVVPPELGYGANDYGPIPGGSTLVFEVELLKVEK